MSIINLARKLWRSGGPLPPRSSSADGLDAFDSESTPPRPPSGALGVGEGAWSERLRRVSLTSGIVILAPVFALVASGMWAYKAYAIVPPTASLTIKSTPTGADVTIDGKPSGVTPISLTVAPATYRVVVAASADRQRAMDVTLNPGDSVVREIEWASSSPAAPAVVTTGALRVQTERPGQAVFVDDVRRGTSPVTIDGLAAGVHRVAVRGDGGVLRRQITIKSGETLALVVAPNAPALTAGRLKVSSPILLQLRAGGNLVGNTDGDGVLLPVGDHQIEMTNESLEFSTTRRITISAGRTAELRVTPPNGTLSINAVPWAEVWLNGERLGDTPIANVSRPLGVYTMTLRHPQFGERQRRVTVSANGPTRVGVDMRQP